MKCVCLSLVTLAAASLLLHAPGCHTKSLTEKLGSCIREPAKTAKLTDEQKAELKAKLAAVPKVGETEVGISASVKSEADVAYQDLADDEAVLFMLLAAIECYGKHKLISPALVEELTRAVFAKYLSVVGEAGPVALTEPVRGRIENALKGDASFVIGRLKAAGIK